MIGIVAEMEKNLYKTPLLIMDALEVHPGLIDGALTLAHILAKKQKFLLGISMVEHLKSTLLEIFPTPIRQNFLEHGVAVLNDVETVNLTSDDQSEQFVGIILFIGADAERMKLLQKLIGSAMVVVLPLTEAEHHALDVAYPNAGHARAQLGVSEEIPGGSPGQTDYQNGACLEWFNGRYDMIRFDHFGTHSDVVNLGEGKEKICRYCGKKEPEVNFSNISHAFPEQIGNKKLVDLLECDSCNEHFGSTLDAHYGVWSLPTRTTARIKGKKNKVPKYRSADQKNRVDYRDGKLEFKIPQGDERVDFDPENKSLKMQFERGSYIPMAIFKSFVKMALAVMPELEYEECEHLKYWILEETHTFESFMYKPLKVSTRFVPGPLPNDKVTYCILKRKVEVLDCPYLIFVLSYANYVYQVALPMPQQDCPDGVGTLTFSYFPHPFETTEHERMYGQTQSHTADMTSPNFRKGEVIPLSFVFEKVEEISVVDGKPIP
ncbi:MULTISPECIES: HNH endonuclease [unclassified Janthinobacterium]|uniref:HNH endonuclease n=1 Tax=unclassified Janthinobacterium TaxID=2610881 RepID=UPI001E5F1A6F|nr:MULTISPECIES: HNH endonuclease [unclassified Janthinobacterium]MCC7641450.1 hypothetical protein [Janthinobacterium sp. EB271-G4-3-1]MCC7690704.1 hypothetical protein [Janthinobacterium sp. EB271-G4-3-2]